MGLGGDGRRGSPDALADGLYRRGLKRFGEADGRQGEHHLAGGAEDGRGDEADRERLGGGIRRPVVLVAEALEDLLEAGP